MGKNLSSFMNPEFLEQYRIQAKKRYDRHKNLFLDKYGINIDLLNSYFPEFYNYIENRQFREAYRCLKAGDFSKRLLEGKESRGKTNQGLFGCLRVLHARKQ